MALKGFLASGFQKLIGASRILGANDRYLGEHNQQSYTSGFPITTTLNAGFNVVRMAPTTSISYSSGTLFSANPTSPTQVVLVNDSSFRITLNNVVTTGGLVINDSGMDLLIGDAITLIYDPSGGRWRDVASSNPGASTYTINLTNTATGIALSEDGRSQLVKITTNTTSNRTLTSLALFSGGSILPTGMEVTLHGAFDLDMTYQLTLQQFTGTVGTPSYENLLINGDFVFSRNATITLKSTDVGWLEISRSTPTYGA
jgi:hypothetical protein